MGGPWSFFLTLPVLTVLVLGGCAATGSVPTPSGAPTASGAEGRSPSGTPLVLDRADFRLGTTVQFRRIPTANELYELQHVTALAHVLLTLSAWPASFADLEGLRNLPPEADLIVVLAGYPPTREACEAWNLLEARQRLVLLVDRPPPTPTTIADLNAMRGLERVIVETDQPSRAGFERLQRPLSFRVLRD